MCEVTPDAKIHVPPRVESVGRARRFLSARMCPQHSATLSDTAVLLVSELVTNAVLHGGPPIDVEVRCTRDCDLHVLVRDGIAAPPQEQDPTAESTGGRGIALVALLSEDWGVDRHPGDGKTVRFSLHVRSPGGSDART